MALFSNLQLTNAGQQAVNDYILGSAKTPIALSAIAIGDGAKPVNPAAQRALVHEVKRLAVENSVLQKGVLTVTARLSTDSITQDITHREIGLFSGTTLFAYANAGDDYDYIPAAGQNTAVVKLITVRITVGTIDVRLETLPTEDYVTYAGLEQRVKSEVDATVPNAVKQNFAAELPKAVKSEIDAQIATATAAEMKKQLPPAVDAQMDAKLPDRVQTELGKLIKIGELDEKVNTAVKREIYDSEVSETSTPAGEYTRYGQLAHLTADHIPSGALRYVKTRMQPHGQTNVPMRMIIEQSFASGVWTFVGCSTNAIIPSINEQNTFEFADIHIRTFPTRIGFVTQPVTSWPTAGLREFDIYCSSAGPDNYTQHPSGGWYNGIIEATFGFRGQLYAGYAHIFDDDCHLTPRERRLWNQCITDLSTHRNDKTAHTTQEEKNGWNAKLDEEDLIADDSLDLAAHCATLDERQFNACYVGSQYAPSGRLLAIELPCRTEGNFTGSTIPVYLQLLRFTEGETKLEFVASSDNMATPGPGVVCRWTFEEQDVQLDGGAIALYLGTVPKFSQVQLKFDALVCAAADERSGILTNNATARVSHTIPALKFLVSRPILASPQELRRHALNADSHVSKPDRTKWDQAAADISTHDTDAVRHVDAAARLKWDTAANDITTHTADTEQHLQPEERDGWNEHVADTELHLQGGEREKIAAAVNAKEVGTAISEATCDAVETTRFTKPTEADGSATCFRLDSKYVPTGRVLGISIKCRGTASRDDVSSPQHISVWEVDDDDTNLVFLGSSSNAVVQETGETAEWLFDALELHGKSIRVAPQLTPSETWPGVSPTNWSMMGVALAARDEDDTQSYSKAKNGTNINYLPELTFRYLETPSKFAPRSHAEDAAIHLTAEQADALAWLIEHQAELQALIPQGSAI